MFSLTEILDIAITLEQNGAHTCKKLIEKSEYPEMTRLLEWIAEEEQKHLKWFLQLKNTITEDEDKRFQADVNAILIKDIVGKQTFSLKDVDISLIKDKTDLVEILIEFERDTILFYELLSSFIEDTETKEQLDCIVAEENNHIEKLKARI